MYPRATALLTREKTLTTSFPIERTLDAPIEGVPIKTPKPIGRLRRIWQGVGAVAHWLFGLVSLIVLLSITATLPVIQFLSLGYLLESSARIIRSGRIRDGFVGINLAARIGSVGAGAMLCMLPVRMFSSLWNSSYLLNGDVGQTRALRFILFLSAFLAITHIAWATFRGGNFRHFCWPAPIAFWKRFLKGKLYDEASYRLLAFADRLQIGHLFSLGWRGFLGASIYLFLPVSMMALAPSLEKQGLAAIIALVGGFALSIVLVYVPFAQSELAVSHQFGSQFNLRQIRQQFKRAPIAHWFALLLTLTLALPLYILKAELIPREAAWLPSLVFVAFMLPARLAVGWAVGRAKRREEPRFFLSRWLAWFGLAPIAIIYALIVYGTQFTSWYGSPSLYEQHAFLLPVPFLGY